MMRFDQIVNHMNRHMQTLKIKYRDFSNGIVQAIIEEEMKIRREEVDARARTSHQREESRGT